MPATKPLIHIVNPLASLGGGELHAYHLAQLLRRNAEVRLWATEPPAGRLALPGVRHIHPYRGEFPSGGTLVLVGTYFAVGAWIQHCRPRRVIVIYNQSFPERLFELLLQLREYGLPEPEIAYVSSSLAASVGLPGRIVVSPIDTGRFSPRPAEKRSGFVVGRHSRDDPQKHHPADPSLYKMLAFAGCRVRIMGGTCQRPAFERDGAGIELLPTETEAAEAFLQGLDCFFYRTHPGWYEPSGRAVFEALSCGLPVVAEARGGYTDWITHGENGFLVSGQEDAFDRILSLRDDPPLRQRLGEAARARTLALSGPQALRELAEWYLA